MHCERAEAVVGLPDAEAALRKILVDAPGRPTADRGVAFGDAVAEWLRYPSALRL